MLELVRFWTSKTNAHTTLRYIGLLCRQILLRKYGTILIMPINPGGYVEFFLKLLYGLHNRGYNSSKSLDFSDLNKLVTMRPEQGLIQLEVSTGILSTHSTIFCGEQTDS